MLLLLLFITFIFLSIALTPQLRNVFVWIFIYFMTDPGGIVGGFLSKSQAGGTMFTDYFLVASFAFLIIGKYQIKDFFNDKLAKNIFLALLIFALYKIIVWGYIVPAPSFNDFLRYCIVRERDVIFGFLLIIPVYLFAKKDLKTFLKTLIVLGTAILFLSLISILFEINIIEITELERYTGTGITRYFIAGYGLLVILIPITLVVLIGKIKIDLKYLLYIGAIFVLIIIVVSLTKGLYLAALGSIIGGAYLTTKILKIRVVKAIWQGAGFFLLIFVILNTMFPDYSSYSKRTFADVLLLATIGQTSDGSTSRFWQIPALTYEIEKNPLLGTGQGYSQLAAQFDINQFDATDFSLLAHIMQYGAIGIFIYLIYYFRVYKLIKDIYNRFLLIDKNRILKDYKYELIFSIAAIAYFISYLAVPHSIFAELTSGKNKYLMTIHTGILLACAERIRLKMNSAKQNSLQLENQINNKNKVDADK